ncbi:hypothetical protein D3C74_415340 [compost metagenome]
MAIIRREFSFPHKFNHLFYGAYSLIKLPALKFVSKLGQQSLRNLVQAVLTLKQGMVFQNVQFWQKISIFHQDLCFVEALMNIT